MAEADSALTRQAVLGTTWWQPLLLGTVLLLAGLFILGNAVAAAVLSAMMFGVALLAAGLFEIGQSLWVRHWSGLAQRLLVGGLYVAGGVVLLADPRAASDLMTLIFAFALVASGAVRSALAIMYYWQRFGWLLLASGIVGILAGLVIVLKWPLSGLWVFGLGVGLDLVLHGVWWVVQGWAARHEPRPA